MYLCKACAKRDVYLMCLFLFFCLPLSYGIEDNENRSEKESIFFYIGTSYAKIIEFVQYNWLKFLYIQNSFS